jgi:glycosyltransferase involved in cell wall biosynthesis
MPVLEGLANGAPVLCSDLAPHREIASDAALFVSPHNTSSMAEALLQIHTETAQRQRLALAGYDRARRLTPEATAARWSSIHQSLLS